MQSYTTRNALKTVVENFRKPHQLFMYHPIKFEINGFYPKIKTNLYSKNINGTTYWIANMTSSQERDRQILTHDGKFREDDFLQVFDEVCKSLGLFVGQNIPSTIAEQCYTTAIKKYLMKNNIKTVLKKKSAHFFAMTETQMFKYRNFDDGSLPIGYSIEKADPSKHFDRIVASSSSSENENVDLICEKLRRFPALFVKKGDELAGFISSESHGALTNLHVFDKHRGQNLGEKLEIGAAKMAIKSGIRPCKFIDTTYDSYLEKTKKTKLMNIVESKGQPIIVDQNTYTPTSNFATI